jgi:hypothetical protein
MDKQGQFQFTEGIDIDSLGCIYVGAEAPTFVSR